VYVSCPILVLQVFLMASFRAVLELTGCEASPFWARSRSAC
jgi:hypothetical protein